MDPLTKSTDQTGGVAIATPNLAGETFGDFHLLRKLGQGGMGQVYLAEQVSLKRKVALKMLREEVAANPVALARFQSESKTIAKLSHANVVQAYTVGEHAGRNFLALEYVDGISLREYMMKKGGLEVPLVISIMRQVANALNRASELGIVHRDIKPENILVTRKGEAKVADFGLSLCLSVDERVDLTRAGSTVGTPLYMSPEQIEGKDIDCRSDIYSFGVTCYHMLAGQPPFDGSNAYAVAAKHMHEEPARLEKKRPDVPTSLCKVIHKMMAKNPGERYASARHLLDELSRVRKGLSNASTSITMDEETPAEMPVQTAPKAPKWKKPLLLAGGGLAAVAVLAVVSVVLLLGAAFAWTHRPHAEPEPRAAVENPKPADPQPDPIETLKQTVDEVLRDKSPKPGGVDACIDLAVHYLEQNKTSDAEALFKRMTDRRPPSAYYFVGRLGLAVTDAAQNNPGGARSKFQELFDGKAKDNRVQILNDYLTRSPDFAAWVNEADLHNIRSGKTETGVRKGFRPPPSKFPFLKK